MRYPFFLASLGLLASAADPQPSGAADKPFDCGTGTQSADQSYLDTIQQLQDGKGKGKKKEETGKRGGEQKVAEKQRATQ